MNRRLLVQRMLLGGAVLGTVAAHAAAATPPTNGLRSGFRLAVLAPDGRSHELAQAFARHLRNFDGRSVRLDTLAAAADLAPWRLREPGADNIVLLARWQLGAPLAAHQPAADVPASWTTAAVLSTAPLMLVARRPLPESLHAWRDAALADPAALRFGSDANDAIASRVAAAWMAGFGLAEARHVPFRGPAQLLPALVGARLDATVQSAGEISAGRWCDGTATGLPGSYGSLLAAHRAQTVAILAVAATQRLAVLPEVPTLNQALRQTGHQAARQQVLLAAPQMPPQRLRLLAEAAASFDGGCA